MWSHTQKNEWAPHHQQPHLAIQEGTTVAFSSSNNHNNLEPKGKALSGGGSMKDI